MTTKIQLEKGTEIDGANVMVLTMREPTVADQLAAAEIKGTDALKEVTLIANLCDVSPDDIKRLSLRDYYKVQAAYADFT